MSTLTTVALKTSQKARRAGEAQVNPRKRIRQFSHPVKLAAANPDAYWNDQKAQYKYTGRIRKIKTPIYGWGGPGSRTS